MKLQLFIRMFKDVATIVAEKTINPETGRSYTVSGPVDQWTRVTSPFSITCTVTCMHTCSCQVSMIQSAMKDSIHYSIHSSKSSKQQAMEVIRQLRRVMPLARVHMRLRVQIPFSGGGRDKLQICYYVLCRAMPCYMHCT